MIATITIPVEDVLNPMEGILIPVEDILMGVLLNITETASGSVYNSPS